jgi:hypothetical protein
LTVDPNTLLWVIWLICLATALTALAAYFLDGGEL